MQRQLNFFFFRESGNMKEKGKNSEGPTASNSGKLDVPPRFLRLGLPFSWLIAHRTLTQSTFVQY
jgi:hypothetical protein